MNRRILRSIYAVGLDSAGPAPAIDAQADAQVAQAVASEGIVLLRNRNHALPLSGQIKRIAVIGGYADSGVMSGARSSQVQSAGGPAISVPLANNGALAHFITPSYPPS